MLPKYYTIPRTQPNVGEMVGRRERDRQRQRQRKREKSWTKAGRKGKFVEV